MKRSNILLILLFALLYVIPFLVWMYFVYAGDKSYTGISDKYQVVKIDNPDLTANQVAIDTQRASAFPKREMLETSRRSYLYYKGNKQYLPEVSVYGDTIRIGKAQDAKDKDLTLNIHIAKLKTVLLNGQVIWEK